jgi:hypothetical protein
MTNRTTKPRIGKATISGGGNYFDVPYESVSLDFSDVIPEEVGKFRMDVWAGYDRKLHVSCHGTFELPRLLKPEEDMAECDLHLNGAAIKQ